MWLWAGIGANHHDYLTTIEIRETHEGKPLFENTHPNIALILRRSLAEPLPKDRIRVDEQRIDHNGSSHANQEGNPIGKLKILGESKDLLPPIILNGHLKHKDDEGCLSDVSEQGG